MANEMNQVMHDRICTIGVGVMDVVSILSFLSILFFDGILLYRFFGLIKEYKESNKDKSILFLLFSILIVFISINLICFHMRNHVKAMPKTWSAPYVKDIPAKENIINIIPKETFFDLRI